jgi:hypothetical protein
MKLTVNRELLPIFVVGRVLFLENKTRKIALEEND